MKTADVVGTPSLEAIAADADSPLASVEADMRRLMSELVEVRSTIRRAETTQTEAMRRFLLELLDALDAFDRVFKNIRSKESQVSQQMKVWIGNFRTVRRLLEKPLSEQAVVRIEIVDQVFDPQWHRVTEVIQEPTKSEGTIVEEVKAGYLWRGQVLRKVEVIVVGPPDGTAHREQEGL